MSFGLGLLLLVVGLVLIEALNVMLGLWSDRVADRLRRNRRTAKERFPWSDRTGT
jgi:hypothetical protein